MKIRLPGLDAGALGSAGNFTVPDSLPTMPFAFATMLDTVLLGLVLGWEVGESVVPPLGGEL